MGIPNSAYSIGWVITIQVGVRSVISASATSDLLSVYIFCSNSVELCNITTAMVSLKLAILSSEESCPFVMGFKNFLFANTHLEQNVAPRYSASMALSRENGLGSYSGYFKLRRILILKIRAQFKFFCCKMYQKTSTPDSPPKTEFAPVPLYSAPGPLPTINIPFS